MPKLWRRNFISRLSRVTRLQRETIVPVSGAPSWSSKCEWSGCIEHVQSPSGCQAANKRDCDCLAPRSLYCTVASLRARIKRCRNCCCAFARRKTTTTTVIFLPASHEKALSLLVTISLSLSLDYLSLALSCLFLLICPITAEANPYLNN